MAIQTTNSDRNPTSPFLEAKKQPMLTLFNTPQSNQLPQQSSFRPDSTLPTVGESQEGRDAISSAAHLEQHLYRLLVCQVCHNLHTKLFHMSQIETHDCPFPASLPVTTRKLTSHCTRNLTRISSDSTTREPLCAGWSYTVSLHHAPTLS